MIKKSANCQKLLTKLVKGWAWLKLQKIPQYYYNRPNLLSERARGWLYVTTPWSFPEWWAWGERQPSPGCFRREREVEDQHWRSSGSSQRPGQPLGPSQKEGPGEGKRWLPSDCLQKEVSIPWPFPKGGDREGKAVTTPGEDQERDNPWALPKGKAKRGQTDNPWALPKENAKGGHMETTTLVGSFWREIPRATRGWVVIFTIFSVIDSSIYWSMLLSVKTSLLDSNNKTKFTWTTSQPLVWQMNWICLLSCYVMFVSCSVLSLDQHLTYFLFVSNINHSIYIEWLVLFLKL